MFIDFVLVAVFRKVALLASSKNILCGILKSWWWGQGWQGVGGEVLEMLLERGDVGLRDLEGRTVVEVAREVTEEAAAAAAAAPQAAARPVLRYYQRCCSKSVGDPPPGKPPLSPA